MSPTPPGGDPLRLEAWTRRALLALCAGFGLLAVALPLMALAWRSLTDGQGRFAGGHSYVGYLADPVSRRALLNTLAVASAASVLATALAFVYAFALARARVRAAWLWRHLAMLPLLAPTMLYGIGLVYLLGKQGLLTTGFFGLLPWTFDFPLYGFAGILLAEVVLVFPAAFMVLTVALSAADQRLYDAAATLGAGRWRRFRTVTLPSCRLGIAASLLMGFILAFTDFGAPKIVGGQFHVLSVDIYQQVIGQQNLAGGSAVSLILLGPTLVAFFIHQRVQRRQASMVSGRSVPLRPQDDRRRDLLLTVACAAIALPMLAIVLAPALASFVPHWPYSISAPGSVEGPAFSLRHYDPERLGRAAGGGYAAYYNSLVVALATAALGTAFCFVSAWLAEKQRLAPIARGLLHGGAMAPLALPGLVLGLAMLLVVAPRSFAGLPNPLHGLGGTFAILVACNIVHFSGVGFLTASTALRQIDPEFESVAHGLGRSTLALAGRVTLPLCLPAVVQVAGYYFVSSMATVSAVVFLCAPETVVASVAVVNLDDAGMTQPAAAMCLLILATNLVARFGLDALTGSLRRAATRWRRPTEPSTLLIKEQFA